MLFHTFAFALYRTANPLAGLRLRYSAIWCGVVWYPSTKVLHTTQHHIPEDHNLNIRRPENPKPPIVQHILCYHFRNMSPYCHEMGNTEHSGNTEEAVGLETAAPDTGSPAPSPAPSVTPTSSTPSEESAEEAAAQYNDQRLMVMNPPSVLENGAPDCLPIDHNLPHLLVCSFAK
jgi:hypothetical protein